ncbi:MAG: hypothetical protein HZB30_10875 [Nitrospirae bacterium]|nr:hypothetical protein [Nitrospirota bacterium]
MPEEQKIEEDEEGINLLDYLIVLAKRKNLILKITLTVAIFSFIIAILSKTSFYEAETSIFPNQQENINLASQFMSNFGFFPSGGGNLQNRRELLIEIMKSRTFTGKIIERFKLKELYRAKDLKKARIMFLRNLTIEPDFTDKSRVSLLKGPESPLTKISFRDQDPERAANIANAIVDELKIFLNNIAISEASQRRLFFEEQLKQAREALIKAEEDIKLFQQKTGLLQIESQTTMVIEKIANLQAQITAKEVELQVMRSYSTVSNPDVQRVEETIRILKRELAKLEVDESNSKDLFIPTGTIPSLGLEYKRKFRELKFNETLYEIMVKQYELAKIDESKDTVLIQVIDKAVPPDQKNSMRTWGGSKALFTTGFAFLFSCFLAIFMEYREKAPKNERLDTLKGYLSFRKKA